MKRSYDIDSCAGKTGESLCQFCLRRDYGLQDWRVYIAPAIDEHGECFNFIDNENEDD